MSETGGAGRPIATAVRAVRGEGGGRTSEELRLALHFCFFDLTAPRSRQPRRFLDRGGVVSSSLRAARGTQTPPHASATMTGTRADRITPATRPPRSIRRRDARAPIADVVFQIDSIDPPLSRQKHVVVVVRRIVPPTDALLPSHPRRERQQRKTSSTTSTPRKRTSTPRRRRATTRRRRSPPRRKAKVEKKKKKKKARSTHWSPYDRVGVVNADP